MTDEAESLFKTLTWTIGMIMQSGPEDRKRIAAAYSEAQTLIVGIPKDKGDARPRIVACFERSDTYRAVDDISCVGWILTAIQERVNEQNLPNWRKFRKLIQASLKTLPLEASPTVH